MWLSWKSNWTGGQAVHRFHPQETKSLWKKKTLHQNGTVVEEQQQAWPLAQASSAWIRLKIRSISWTPAFWPQTLRLDTWSPPGGVVFPPQITWSSWRRLVFMKLLIHTDKPVSPTPALNSSLSYFPSKLERESRSTASGIPSVSREGLHWPED